MTANGERTVSMRAWKIIGKIYNTLSEQCELSTEYSVHQMLNRFCVRLVFCLYAEDSGIFNKRQFLNYLQHASTPSEMRSDLFRLFCALNLPPEQRTPSDPVLLAFRYIPGGLFAGAERDSMPPFNDKLCSLITDEAAAGFNWACISPTVFGELFENTINPKTRRSGGMHYTSVRNIHKIIDPLFLDDLKAEFASILVNTKNSGNARIKYLKNFCKKLASLTFLDPACGSGNFLTETFISLRRLENAALRHLAGERSERVSLVSVNRFYGIEIDDFAVAVAETALWIASAQMQRKSRNKSKCNLHNNFFSVEACGNIRKANALAVDWLGNIPTRHIDYIISNPPFVGYTHQSREQKTDIRRVWGNAMRTGLLDYACCWFKKAADLMQISPTTHSAFVSTDSIVQGEQAAILWKYLISEKGCRINFAYRTFKWSSESENTAAVYCVIIGFNCSPAHKPLRIINEKGQIQHVGHINEYLLDAPYAFIAGRRSPLCRDAPRMLKGSQPTDQGNLLLDPEEYSDFIAREPRAASFIRPFIGAENFINGEKRYCLWLAEVPEEVLRSVPLVAQRLERIKIFRLKSSKKSTRMCADSPALFQEIRQPRCNYLTIPCVSSERREYIPMAFSDAETIAGNTLLLIPEATVYHFGILTSAMHMVWTRTVTGYLGSSIGYSASIVYNNFPWPTPSDTQRAQIEALARIILATRADYPDSTLAELYNPLLMPVDLRRAHGELDTAVDAAYGRRFTDDASRISHLFTLYKKLNTG